MRGASGGYVRVDDSLRPRREEVVKCMPRPTMNLLVCAAQIALTVLDDNIM